MRHIEPVATQHNSVSQNAYDDEDIEFVAFGDADAKVSKAITRAYFALHWNRLCLICDTLGNDPHLLVSPQNVILRYFFLLLFVYLDDNANEHIEKQDRKEKDKY